MQSKANLCNLCSIDWKTVAGLSKTRHQGLARVDWQFTLALAAYDLIRLPKLLGAAA